MDTTLDYTARLSVGMADGIGRKGYDSLTSHFDFTNGNVPVGAIYEVKGGLNVEVPVVFNLRNEGRWYAIAAPALVYSQNKTELDYYAFNSVTFESKNVHVEETYEQIGGKLYLGAGFGRKIGWHGELLPYVGYSKLDEKKETVRANATGSSEKNSGSMLSYGITGGAYYTPKFAPYLEFGGRLGFAGAEGKVGGNDIEQSGLLVALEIGAHF
jgi:hypothetical protein